MADQPRNHDLAGLDGTLLRGRYALDGWRGCRREVAVYRGTDRLSGSEVSVELVAPSSATISASPSQYPSGLPPGLSLSDLLEPFDAGTTEGGLRWSVLPSAKGEVLAARMARARRLRAGDAVEIAVAIAEVVDVLHRSGAVHGNLHPSRVFVREALGSVRAQLISGILRTTAIDVEGGPRAVLSPLEYAAPELLLGGAPDTRSDVYALAALLYELLVGTPPHDDPTPANHVAAVLTRAPEPLPDHVPSRLADEVLRALSRDPAKRPRSAAAFGQAMIAALASSSTIPPPPMSTNGRVTLPAIVPTVQIRLLSDPGEDEPPIVDEPLPVVRSSPPHAEIASRGEPSRRRVGSALVLAAVLGGSLFLGYAVWPRTSAVTALAPEVRAATSVAAPPAVTGTVPTTASVSPSASSGDEATRRAPPPRRTAARPRTTPMKPKSPSWPRQIDDLKPLPK